MAIWAGPLLTGPPPKKTQMLASNKEQLAKRMITAYFPPNKPEGTNAGLFASQSQSTYKQVDQ